jgi:predicted homoserine dehydrogenase-like protein
MNLYRLLQKRMAAGHPVRVGLIGAGKFGSMFLSQVPTTPGLEVAAIADLSPERAQQACRSVGWSPEHIAAIRFVRHGECGGRRTCRPTAGPGGRVGWGGL